MRHHAQKLWRVERMVDGDDTQSITVVGGTKVSRQDGREHHTYKYRFD